MSGGLQVLRLKESWYQLCQDRKEWLARCHEGVDEVASCRKRNTCCQQSVPLYMNAGDHLENKEI